MAQRVYNLLFPPSPENMTLPEEEKNFHHRNVSKLKIGTVLALSLVWPMPIINTRTSLGFCMACNICNFEHYGILEYFADWVIFQFPSSPPCKSFPASSPTAKYFPDSSSVDKRTKREQTQEKFVMSEMSNVRNLVTICHVVRFCAIITFPPPSWSGHQGWKDKRILRHGTPYTWSLMGVFL